MRHEAQMTTDASGIRVGIASSAYHREIVQALESGARSVFADSGGREEDLLVVESPGAFELVAISAALAQRNDIDAIVALGCVIQGETTHDTWINGAVSQGLAQISITTGKPVAFGVITCDSMEQARARSGGEKGNKGEEAMRATLAAVHIIQDVRAGSGTVSQ